MTAAPTIRNPDQRTVLSRFARGEDIDKIAADTNLTRDRVSDVITNVAGFDRGRARAAVLAYDAEQKAAQERVTATNPSIEDLLTTAEKSGITKAERLAGRIRTQLDELANVLRNTEQERVLRTTIAVLRQHIDKTTKELQRLKGGPKRPVENPFKAAKVNGTPNGTVPGKVIRQWCRDNGVECPPIGKVPNAVRALYDQAQAAP